MSYEEQQSDELDALQAIYPNEFKLFNKDDDDLHKFSIKISNELNDDDCDKYEIDILFILPKNYPDIGPMVEILSTKNLEDCDELKLIDLLNDFVQNNLGNVMIFSLISHITEWLMTLKSNKLIERQQEEQRRKRELEELERKKFEGTRVTVETFISWKLKFDAEMTAIELAKKMKELKKDDNNTNQRLTGKEMFMRDKNLIDSDLNFIDIVGGVDNQNDEFNNADVNVDESLFQDDVDVDDLIE